MQEKQLATYAALITEVLKKGNQITPNEAIQLILSVMPDVSTDTIIHVLYNMAHELQVEYSDYYDLIRQLLDRFTDVTTNTLWNSTCQTIAQAIYVGLLIAKALPLPEKWRSVVEAVIEAYEEVKE